MTQDREAEQLARHTEKACKCEYGEMDVPGTIRALATERDALKSREKHFAEVLCVADGGKYRNDWDAAIRRVIAERDALREALIEAKSELRDLGPDHPAKRQIDAALKREGE